MNIGSIIFVRGKTPLSKAIKYFDNGEFSHVAISVTKNGSHILEAQYFTSVRVVPFYFDDYEVVSIGLTEEERCKLVQLGLQMVGKYYDYKTILWYVLENLFNLDRKQIWNNPNNLICSELIDMLLFALNKIPEDEYLGDKTPNELYRYLKHRFE
jgi:hypothetical protein